MDDFALLNGRYEMLGTTETANNQADEVDIVREMKALGLTQRTIATQNRFKRTIAHFKSGATNVKEIGLHLHRLRWVTFDGDEFKRLLSRLSEMINYLHELLSDHDKETILKTTRSSYMEIVEVHKTANRIEHLVQALTLLQGVEAVSSNTSQHFLEMQRENEEASARIARFKALIPDLEAGGLESGRHATMLEATKIMYNRDVARGGIRRVVATYEVDGRTHDVWIEWKRYTLLQVDKRKSIWAMHPETREHIQKLAWLLKKDRTPKEFCTVDCLGYFDDRDIRGRFADPLVGLVYDKPAHCRSGAVPISLLELFTRQGYSKPSLTARINLAYRLASCLGYLHVVNWLHKGLRSGNVIVFPDRTGHLDIGTCQLSGFEYARPDANGQTTVAPPIRVEWEIYRHPDYQGEDPRPARKTFDIYSLGIILIEIAQWQSIGTIMQINYETISLPPIKAVRRELLDIKPEYLVQVSGSVGDRFRRVVQRCLEGPPGFDLESCGAETSAEFSAKLQRQYNHYIVNELGDLTSKL